MLITRQDFVQRDNLSFELELRPHTVGASTHEIVLDEEMHDNDVKVLSDVPAPAYEVVTDPTLVDSMDMSDKMQEAEQRITASQRNGQISASTEAQSVSSLTDDHVDVEI